MSLNADGSDVRQIAAGDQPIWSPDGHWIAYTRRGSSVAFVVHPDGSDGHQIEQDTVSWLDIWWSAAWSPDSQHLAIAEGSRIAVVSPKGGDRRVLADFYDPIGVAWSPHGKTIAFVGSEPGIFGRATFEVPAEGGTPQKILDSSDFFGVPWFTSWSLDGSRLLVSGFNDVVTSDSNGGALHVLYRGPDYPWQITGRATWTSESRRVLYARVDRSRVISSCAGATVSSYSGLRLRRTMNSIRHGRRTGSTSLSAVCRRAATTAVFSSCGWTVHVATADRRSG